MDDEGQTSETATPQDAVPGPAPETDALPVPESYLLVEYTMPAGTHTPVYHADRYWHGGSHYALPASVAQELTQVAGFAVIGPATDPGPKRP